MQKGINGCVEILKKQPTEKLIKFKINLGSNSIYFFHLKHFPFGAEWKIILD